MSESTNSALDSNNLEAKIELLVQSQMDGLAAREKFMTDKVKHLAREKYDQFCSIEETCREKLHAQKEASVKVLDDGLAAAFAAAKKCRVDFVEDQLVKKEIVKGELEELLNKTIQQIKELKVEGIFAESGMPHEQHITAIEADIAAAITEFDEASQLLLTDTDAVTSTAFVQVLAADLTAFEDTLMTDGSGGQTGSCLDEVRTTFDKLFRGDPSALQQTDDTRGEGPIYDAATTLCLTKMDAFRDEAADEIGDKVDSYTADAAKQENKAKETFLRLIESSMVKLHGLTDLTATERVELKEAIIGERADYATRVMGWSSELTTTLTAFEDGSAASDQESTDLIDETFEGGFTVKANAKRAKFVEDFATVAASDTAVEAGDDTVGEWLEDYFDEKLEELNDQIKTESMIGAALSEEIKTWLTSHVSDLQEALAQICEQEHAYHYHPPGFHVDQTAMELQAFQQLSEKFALVVVQMTGQFDSWSKTMMEKITDLKEDKKEDIDLRRRAAEHSLSMASNSFGEGIEFVRGSVEMKAVNDQQKIMETCTDAREIVTYQLSEKKDNLWRQISYLTKKLYADERPDYNAKIKHEILVLFKEFKDVIVECTNNINESQHEKWAEY